MVIVVIIVQVLENGKARESSRMGAGWRFCFADRKKRQPAAIPKRSFETVFLQRDTKVSGAHFSAISGGRSPRKMSPVSHSRRFAGKTNHV
jgi:hypothetical protein